jgi:hypothetical protein
VGTAPLRASSLDSGVFRLQALAAVDEPVVLGGTLPVADLALGFVLGNAVALLDLSLEDNLAALKFTISEELAGRLDRISEARATFPYSFFTPGMQAMLAGRHAVGNKPKGTTGARSSMHPLQGYEFRSQWVMAAFRW